MNRLIRVWGLSLMGMGLWPTCGAALLIVGAGDQNVNFLNDRSLTNGDTSGLSPRLCAGDFDADGHRDLAIELLLPSSGGRGRLEIQLFRGPFETKTNLSSRSNKRVDLSWEGSTLTTIGGLMMVDVNDDGRDDLIIGRPTAQVDHGMVDILFGQLPPLEPINLDTQLPDLRILGKPGTFLGAEMAAGDFNGDGAKDLVLGPAGNEVYLFLASTALPQGILDLASGNSVPRIIKPGLDKSVVIGDFNRDGKDDLSLSIPWADIGGGTYSGEISIYFGTTTLSNAWSTGNPPANVQLRGAASSLRAMGAGDLTGDQRDELVIQYNSNKLWVLNGSELDSGRATLTLSPGFANSVLYHSLLGGESLMDFGKIQFMDFDHDGADDLFILDGDSKLTGNLTSEFLPNNVSLNQLADQSITFTSPFQEIVTSDFNGDGFQDVAAYEDFRDDIFAPFGAIRIVYGFRPLKNPTVSLLPRSVASPRGTVELSVAGDPTEMNISGDIVDFFQGQWIPFQYRRDVVFTANESSKTVTARFRNGVGRESELAQASTLLTVGSSGIVIGTNRLRLGGTALFDCQVEGSGTLRARIFNAEGEEVRELMNRDVERGVYPVTWEGANSFGQRVGRGFYYLVLEVNGEPITKKILVE